ncbi:MAG TPA: energy transducer TonB [Gemmatimonadaceae bacterium]
MTGHSIALALFLAAGSALGAQTVASSTDCSKLFDRPGTQLDSIHVEVELNYQLAGVPLSSAERLASDIGGTIAFPKPLAIPPVVTVWLEGDSTLGVRRAAQTFRAEVMLLLDRKGNVSRSSVTQSSLVPAIDEALLGASRDIAALGLPDEIVKGARKAHGGALFVRLHMLPVTGQPERPSIDRIAEVGVAALLVPRFEAATDVRWATRPRVPSYPFEMQREGVDGRVVFDFVVRADGTIAPETFTLASATGRQFVQSALRTFNEARFVPATVEGCPVPTIVEQPFSFTIRR